MTRDNYWWANAACVGTDQDEWFDKNGTGIRLGQLERARDICRECPVRKRCFEEALDLEKGRPTRERFGIWAGTTPHQRGRMERTNRARCTSCGEVYDPLRAIRFGPLVCYHCNTTREFDDTVPNFTSSGKVQEAQQ